MNKTLIIYGTRRGATTNTALLIAEILRSKFSHTVDIADSNHIREHRKRIDEYKNIIIGSSIVAGFWKGRILSFAKRDIFKNKNVAVFVTAGGTLYQVEKKGMLKEVAVRQGIEKYIDKYLMKFKFVPISKIAFGGKLIRKEKVIFDSWNREDIINWAMELGNKLNE